MLWDPGSISKEEGEEHGTVPITPILVPLQNKAPSSGKPVPVSVPDVQELKDQFQQQQNMLTQIKETLKQNESQLNSKEKQVEAYANRLSQIRARTKNTQGKRPANPTSPKMQKKLSKENLTKLNDSEKAPGTSPKSRKGKMSELKRCLEENKIKFEQRTGKEQSETKKIESLVEQLKRQLEERDKTIHDLQKIIEQPASKPEVIPKKKPKSDKEPVASKATQTNFGQPSKDSIEIIALKNKIHELEANVMDLEESIKEKESVIEARTQAVTLLSQDLSLKGKNTLENLEETRQEMRTMQNNFIAIEDQLKKDLLDRDNRLCSLEEKCKKLESNNFELSLKNAEQQEKLVNLQTKYLQVEAEKKSLKESLVQGETDDKSEELMKKINVLTKELDKRNKAMIKMKIEHKNKIKNLNRTLDTFKGESDDKAEILRLSNLVDELENIKMTLENRVAELEDEKAVEKKLKDHINELESIIQKQNEEISLHLKTISNLEKDKNDLIQANQDLSIVVENLHTKIQAMENESEAKLKGLSQKLEAECNKLKGDKGRETEYSETNTKSDLIDRKELEEYLISAEISNIHVEEQIELLIREKQMLLEKLKSLSGVSSTDSLSFEKMEHSDLRDDKESTSLGEELDSEAISSSENRICHLEKIVNNQQHLINEFQKAIKEENYKIGTYQQKIIDLEEMIKQLEDVNSNLKYQIEISEMGETDKNTKSNTNIKNRIKKVEMELTESKRIIQDQNEKLKELYQKLEEKEELIKKYTEKIELFEKADWDRQNLWKNAEDECDNIQELQKKCLSLENSLIELNDDCERLRKENIEVVHLLSEEKVKRRQLLEELRAKVEFKDAETQKEDSKDAVEERIEKMSFLIRTLEEKIEKLEKSTNEHKRTEKPEEWAMRDLQEKLEWTIVVLTSKETEIFKLQNMLEDRSKAIEILEGDLKECNFKLEEKDRKLNEVTEELKAKDAQQRQRRSNFEKLQKSISSSNEETLENKLQLKELLMTITRIEENLFKKENELQEIKDILAEKNFDVRNLKGRLEKLNRDPTQSYHEHLENLNKCLRDKTGEYDALLAEKTRLEDLNRSIVIEKEKIQNLNSKLMEEKNQLTDILSEKEKLIVQLNENLKALSSPPEAEKERNQGMDDMKIKMKKLAANLKKKAQNEVELQKQISELQENVKEVTEKWMIEKEENEKVKKELSNLSEKKSSLEGENTNLRERFAGLEKELNQIQVLQEACLKLEFVEKDDKSKIAALESKVAELSQLHENVKTIEVQLQNVSIEKETVLQKLAEVTGKFEQIKFQYDQLLLEKANLEKYIAEVKNAFEEVSTENLRMKAKLQENLAVIESFETELEKTRQQLKSCEERFFVSEERRLSLVNKNDEMCRKIMEDSENLVTIDDLSIRVDELLKSEKLLQDCVRNLETGNRELKQLLDEVQNEKYNLENDLRISLEKLAESGKDLKELKDSENEKINIISELTKEIEKLKSENRLLSSEFEKLNKDYEQFEVDFKENFENSQNVEKTLRHKIEELTNENAVLTEKCSALSERKGEEEEEEKKPKKRKSVTFRTDEVEYIKDLKSMLHTYDDSLKQANKEIENLKAELFKERLRQEVSSVVAQAEEKVESLRSTPEKKSEAILEKSEETVYLSSPEERKFDAKAFFGNEGGMDSFIWDDGWGPEGHLEAEYLGKVSQAERIKTLEAENEKLSQDIQESTAKYAKAIKKLKEVKMAYDKLQSERKGCLSDLDSAIVDELKAQIEDKEANEKKLLKSLENSKVEKENLLKRIEVLSAGNEKFLEMKERQDNEVEIWQRKNSELLKEIAELQQRKELSQCSDDNILMEEIRELKNKLEALEWKNCELNELLEEKEEQLQKQIEARKPFDEKMIDELNEQINALAAENEMLQSILADLKAKSSNEPKPTLRTAEQNQKREEIEKSLEIQKQREQCILELEDLVKLRDNETQSLRQVIQNLESSLHQKDEELTKLSGVILNVSKELEELRQKERDNFETIDLNQEPSDDVLRTYAAELECLLSQREEELQQVHQSRLNDVEELRKRIFTLEDMLRIREEELSQLQSNMLNESNKQAEEETFKKGIFELEEKLKIGEVTVKEPEKKKEGFFNWSLVRGNEQNNVEQELQERLKEIENLKQKIVNLEESIKIKDDKLTSLISLQQKNVTDTYGNGEQQLKLKDDEVMKSLSTNSWAAEAVQRKEEAPSLQSFFNWGGPTGEPKQNTEIEQELEKKILEIGHVKQKIVQLENQQEVNLLRRKIIELEEQLNLRTSTESGLVEETIKEKEAKPHTSFFNWALVTRNEPTPNKNEMNYLKQRITELEDALRVKDEELGRLKSADSDALKHTKEVDTLKERVKHMEEEEVTRREEELNKLNSDIEVTIPTTKTAEIENSQPIENENPTTAHLEELSIEQSKQTQSQATQPENILNWTQVTKDRANDQFNLFSWGAENDTKQVQNTDEICNCKQKIIHLEELLKARENELVKWQTCQNLGNEVNEHIMRISQLEEILRLRDEEINRLHSSSWGPEIENAYQKKLNEVESLKVRISQLENILEQRQPQQADWGWSKENNWELSVDVKELQQNLETLQTTYQTKVNEVETLKETLSQLEGELTMLQSWPRASQKEYDLENVLRYKEEEINHLRGKVTELESVVPLKDEEISRLITRLNELEKSYNDSKLEIERLLNEEKLNTEEKFVEPFQKNMKIPVAFEVEALSRTLNEEKQKLENLKYELSDKDNLLAAKNEEIQSLASELKNSQNKLQEEQQLREELLKVKIQLEKMISELEKNAENSSLQLNIAREELLEIQTVKDELMNNLKQRILELEKQVFEAKERERIEVEKLRSELTEKTNYYQEIIRERKEEEEKIKEALKAFKEEKVRLEEELRRVKEELENKKKDVEKLEELLKKEKGRMAQIEELLELREKEVGDLKETLTHLQEEIGHFRNFEKQVKELRVAQLKEASPEISVTSEGQADLSDWSQNELAELTARLQSDLDTALYMLHQRDVRCDELTFELMQLLDERDTLQLRLSTALRINEELKALTKDEATGSGFGLKESKDLVDQSNDRQTGIRVPSEDLRQLASKISELHSVSYFKDKTVKDDSVQRHKEQMTLLSRVSDSEITLSRDVQSSPAVLLNWVRGKTTPRVMHI